MTLFGPKPKNTALHAPFRRNMPRSPWGLHKACLVTCLAKKKTPTFLELEEQHMEDARWTVGGIIKHVLWFFLKKNNPEISVIGETVFFGFSPRSVIAAM